MKQLLVLMLLISVAAGASAQHHGAVRSHVPGHSHVGIGIGSYAPFGFYNRGFGYSPYNRYSYPYNSYNKYRPSKLDLQIQDIRNDYKDRKWSVKHDKSLTRQQRKELVRTLKQEEGKAVWDAKTGYYKNSR